MRNMIMSPSRGARQYRLKVMSHILPILTILGYRIHYFGRFDGPGWAVSNSHARAEGQVILNTGCVRHLKAA